MWFFRFFVPFWPLIFPAAVITAIVVTVIVLHNAFRPHHHAVQHSSATAAPLAEEGEGV